MEKTVKERLLEYLKAKKIGRNKFERLIGASDGYITNLKSTPRQSKLEKIFEAAPDLNEVWLLTGKGEMFVDKEKEVKHEEQISTLTNTIRLLTEAIHNKDEIITKLEKHIEQMELHIAELEKINYNQ